MIARLVTCLQVTSTGLQQGLFALSLDPRIAAYLRERMRRADAILFTGAGFSTGVRNTAGTRMPLGTELRPHLWALSYPGEAFDEASKLPDLFSIAQARNPKGLRDLLLLRLAVDASSIPDYYAGLFSLPWLRAYTLNVDDLPTAIARQHTLRRRILPLSAITWGERGLPAREARVLEVVHLNGQLADAPDGVTFSPTQYAERLAGQEPLYAQCAVDVLTRPVVYIGTPLDETPLWQHIEMRRRGPRTRREFRRESFLISPTLDRARAEVLDREFHVTHIPMGVEDFSKELLTATAAVVEEGYTVIAAAIDIARESNEPPLAQDLSAAAEAGSPDYLLGRAPDWGDVRDGFAAPRNCDLELETLAKAQLQPRDEPPGTILVSGTAGSGKSTMVMRLALALTAAGAKVAWVDNSVDISPLNLRRWAATIDEPTVLIIDDVDRYGPGGPALAAEMVRGPKPLLLVATIRSGRGADRFADRYVALGAPFRQFDMPDLTNGDIQALIDLLDAKNRLGVLKGRDRQGQFNAFKDVARRQILVAMLEATSGKRFEEVIESELLELDNDTRDLYAIAAVASGLRFGLTRDEMLLAVDDRSAATLASIDALQRRRLIVADPAGTLRVRHRVIAEVLTRVLARDGQLADVIVGLAVAAASKVSPTTKPTHRTYRRIRALMNHDWLTSTIGVPAARKVYEALEGLMQWDHHYWLQRGSYELEHGEFQYAENFLNQAFGLAPTDPLVKTEYAYMTLRRAVIAHLPTESRENLQEGFGLLREAIEDREGSDPHQYHIFGKEGLNWLARGDVTPQEREELLNELQDVVLEGIRSHPSNERLGQLLVEVQKAQLGHVASSSGPQTPSGGTPVVRTGSDLRIPRKPG